jgi:outer membrane immunogenic protein
MYKQFSAFVLVSSILGISIAANAADMGIPPAPVYKVAPYVPPAEFSWTGLYLGGNVGGGWSQGSWGDSLFGINWGNPNNPVFIGGGQVGGNYQIQHFVIGLEADFDWAANHHINNAVTFIPPGGGGPQTFQLTANNKWVTTVAARAGYAFDTVLVYAKGGGGWVGSSNFTLINGGSAVTFSNGRTNTGWLAGGGVEWAFAHNWTVRMEYDFLGLSNRTFVVPAAFPVLAGDTFTTKSPNVQMATVGINYLFNLGNP